MTLDPHCKFCDLGAVAGVTKVGSVFILRDGFPVTPGHRLIIPTAHRHDYFELTDQELRDTREALVKLRKEMFQRDGVVGFNIGWNCGIAAGQTVLHAHCHLIPRRYGDTDDPTGGVRGVIPDRQNYQKV